MAAFGTLMESHERYAYAVAFRLLRDEESSKDVVQEAFIRVWNNFGKYRQEIKFSTWLYKIVINLCYDKIKMNSRRNNIFKLSQNSADIGDIPDPKDFHSELEKSDLCRHVMAVSKELPPKEYLVFNLRDILDLSIEEIAEIVGSSASSVKANLCYARRRIRDAMVRLRKSENL